MAAAQMKGLYHIFIFIDTDPTKDVRIEDELIKIKEIAEVHLVSGQYDILAVADIDLHGKAVFSTVQELSQDLIEKIRKIHGVRDTNTLVPFLSLSKHKD